MVIQVKYLVHMCFISSGKNTKICCKAFIHIFLKYLDFKKVVEVCIKWKKVNPPLNLTKKNLCEIFWCQKLLKLNILDTCFFIYSLQTYFICIYIPGRCYSNFNHLAVFRNPYVDSTCNDHTSKIFGTYVRDNLGKVYKTLF